MKTKVIVEWPENTRKPKNRHAYKPWLDRMKLAVDPKPITVPFVTIYEIKNWFAEKDLRYSRKAVEDLCTKHGLVLHSWGPYCVYFRKVE